MAHGVGLIPKDHQ